MFKKSHSNLLYCASGPLVATSTMACKATLKMRSATRLDMEEQVARLLFVSRDAHPQGVMRLVKGLAESITNVNNDFLDTKMLVRLNIFNIFSSEADPSLQVFDEYTATFDIPFEKRFARPRPHRKLVGPPEFQENVLDSISDVLWRSPYLAWNHDHEVLKYVSILQSQASPVYPFKYTSFGCPPWNKKLEEEESFRKWLDSRGICFLHVHSSSKANSSITSEYIFKHLGSNEAFLQSNGVVFYYKFKEHDARSNTLQAMLNTILAQMIYRYDELETMALKEFLPLRLYRGFTAQDLYTLFKPLATRLSERQGSLVFIISSLDEYIEPYDWFLDELSSATRVSELHYKFVITSTNSTNTQQALSEFPTIDLDEFIRDTVSTSNNLLSNLEFELMQLVQERPQYGGFQTTIRKILLECGRDYHLYRLIIDWLKYHRTSTTNTMIEARIKMLSPICSKNVLQTILESISPDRQIWARKIIYWVACSFRPLTIGEISSAMALDADSGTRLDGFVSKDIATQLRECFGSMFIFENNELHFSHPCVRDFFVSAGSLSSHGWYKPSYQDTFHGELARYFLRYLSLPQVQSELMAFITRYDDEQQSPLFEPRSHILCYMVKYWPDHYKIGSSIRNTVNQLLDPVVVSFLEDEKATRWWAEAYRLLSHPITRTDRSFLSPLPRLANLGLEDLIAPLIVKYRDTRGFAQDCSLAMIEASRYGHIETLRALLEVSRPNDLDLQEALLAAATWGNEPVLIELLKSTIQDLKWPPQLLARAAALGLQQVVQYLLQHGAEVNPPADTLVYGRPPLFMAVRYSHTEVAKILLDGGANLAAQDTSGLTAIDEAFIFGHTATMELLLGQVQADREKAAFSLVSKLGNNRESSHLTQVREVWERDKAMLWKSLNLACKSGQHQIMQLLLAAGAEKQGDDADEYRSLITAASLGYYECTSIFLNQDTDIKTESMGQALYDAVPKVHVDVCRLLLERKAGPNWRPKDAFAADYMLSWAVEKHNLELVKLLITHGAEFNWDGESDNFVAPLFLAAREGLKDIVEYLLEKGADPNRSGSSYEPPLNVAAQYSHTETVQLLLEAGAKIMKGAGELWPTLHLAYDSADVTRLLLENGADVNEVHNGHSALYYAASNDNPEVVELYTQKGADLEIQDEEGWTALSAALSESNAEVSKLLLEAGANVNHKTRSQLSPLHFAMFSNEEDLLRVMLDHRPQLQLDLVDDDGDTAPHLLNQRTPLSCVKLLVNGGMDPNIRNVKDGSTPLSIAVLFENVDVAKYLISKRVDINMVGSMGLGGPLHIACTEGNFELVEYLIKNGADANLVDPGSAGTPLQSTVQGGFALDSTSWSDDEDEADKMKILRFLIKEGKAQVDSKGGLFGNTQEARARVKAEAKFLTQILFPNARKVQYIKKKKKAFSSYRFKPLTQQQYILRPQSASLCSYLYPVLLWSTGYEGKPEPDVYTEQNRTEQKKAK